MSTISYELKINLPLFRIPSAMLVKVMLAIHENPCNPCNPCAKNTSRSEARQGNEVAKLV